MITLMHSIRTRSAGSSNSTMPSSGANHADTGPDGVSGAKRQPPQREP
jgi:hypothetical protein